MCVRWLFSPILLFETNILYKYKEIILAIDDFWMGHSTKLAVLAGKHRFNGKKKKSSRKSSRKNVPSFVFLFCQFVQMTWKLPGWSFISSLSTIWLLPTKAKVCWVLGAGRNQAVGNCGILSLWWHHMGEGQRAMVEKSSLEAFRHAPVQWVVPQRRRVVPQRFGYSNKKKKLFYGPWSAKPSLYFCCM